MTFWKILIFFAPVPAGETCVPLEPISKGGVIYSDLLLSPGVIAHYVCQDGYVLHGHDKRECAPDGGWINSEKGTPVCRGMYASIPCQSALITASVCKSLNKH